MTMATRIIAFLGGALFGALCMLAVFHVAGDLRSNWGIVSLAAGGMGLLSLLFGKEFWDTVLKIIWS
jgi:hypothetical protein